MKNSLDFTHRSSLLVLYSFPLYPITFPCLTKNIKNIIEIIMGIKEQEDDSCGGLEKSTHTETGRYSRGDIPRDIPRDTGLQRQS